ncbi:hypothetical protein WA026_002280 [Henosepilachna vigintioctopunctata]|uniref:Uncharacterized protein n=1 Tax=Henosepilachna vigintioctopunctata TaxID=420089 RepID=A0AAW1TQX2_9CUCU
MFKITICLALLVALTSASSSQLRVRRQLHLDYKLLDYKEVLIHTIRTNTILTTRITLTKINTINLDDTQARTSILDKMILLVRLGSTLKDNLTSEITHPEKMITCIE